MTELNGSRLAHIFSSSAAAAVASSRCSLPHLFCLFVEHSLALFSFIFAFTHSFESLYSFVLFVTLARCPLTHWNMAWTYSQLVLCCTHTRTHFVANYNGWNPKRCCDTIIVSVIRTLIISIMILEWKPFLWWIGCITLFVVSYKRL